MKNLLKTIVTLLVLGGVFFWALNYIFLNKQAPKSKASGETIDVIYDPPSAASAANQDFSIVMKIKPSVDVAVRGYSFRVPFDKTKLRVKSIEYKLGVGSTDLGQTNNDLTAVNSDGVAALVGEIQNNTGQVVSTSATGTELLKLTFTALSTSGTTLVPEAEFYLVNSDGLISGPGITTVPKFDVNGGGATTSIACTSFSDDFSGTTLNTGNWRLWTNGNGTASVSAGLLIIDLPAATGTAKLVNIESISKPLAGDFTSEITFNSRNDDSTYEFFQFNSGLEGVAGSGGFNGFAIRLLNGTLQTEVFGADNPTNPGAQNHNIAVNKVTPVKLKLERTGSTVKMSYDLMTGQGYQVLRTFNNFNTNPGRAVVGIQHTGGTNLHINGKFDNYSQNCLAGSGASSTAGVTGNVKLALKLKFQGINKKPVDSLNSMTVKVKVKKEGTTDQLESSGTFTANDQGIWSGAVGFNITDPSGKWTVYVKGPQHLQKKICESAPTETTGGTYRCGNGAITLVTGDNNFDFTKITLLVGDLDQSGVVDAVDLGLVKNNLGKTDATTLTKADLNRDGVVDTQDFSLILAALAVRTDEL